MDKVDAKEFHRSYNPQVIQALWENDCNLSKPRPIINVFYSDDPSSKAHLRQELTDRGLNVDKIEVSEPNDDRPEYCIAVIMIYLVDGDWLDYMTDTCVDAALACGVEYDGWFTEVDKAQN